MNHPYRALLKISGEALKGNTQKDIYCNTTMDYLVQDIKTVYDKGIQICLVVGGGNICRGKNITNLGIDRVPADYMGILSTVINGLALEEKINKIGIKAKILSSIQIDNVCELYTTKKAHDYIDKGKILIFVGGINNPFFTTDTVAVIRSIEMNCDILFKGTHQVDGVYSADPNKFTNSKKFDTITYDEILKHKLQIMDMVSIILAQANKLCIKVFRVNEPGNFNNVINNQGSFTKII